MLLSLVAVAQTRGEATGSLLRVGSEIRHRVRQASPVRLDAVAPSPSDAISVNVLQRFRDGFMQQPHWEAAVIRSVVLRLQVMARVATRT